MTKIAVLAIGLALASSGCGSVRTVTVTKTKTKTVRVPYEVEVPVTPRVCIRALDSAADIVQEFNILLDAARNQDWQEGNRALYSWRRLATKTARLDQACRDKVAT
jgi:uncharacterized protein YceK